MGRSDIFLKLEIIKKTIGIVSLVIAVFCFDSPIVIAMTGAITTIISCFINAYPNSKLIAYSYLEQLRDIAPSMVFSLIMFCGVMMLSGLSVSALPLMLIQIIMGVSIYFILSIVFRPEPYRFFIGQIKNARKRFM